MTLLQHFHHPLDRFTADPEIIAARLRTPPNRPERFALAATIGTLIGALLLSAVAHGLPWDFNNYVGTAYGDFEEYFYPYWLLPFFRLFTWPSPLIGYVFWGLANIAGIWFAGRVFGGNLFFTLTSFQMISLLVNGQIVGLMAFGLALLWWGMARHRWLLAGLGMLLSAIKIQTGCIFAFALWWYAPNTWKDKLKPAAVFALVAALSLIVYPGWVIDIIDNVGTDLDYTGNISMWDWVGPAALVLWLPVFLVPMNRTQRLVLIFAATFITMPYVKNYDLLMLFALPVAWPYLLLANLAHLSNWGNYIFLELLWILLLGIYLSILVPVLRERLSHLSRL